MSFYAVWERESPESILADNFGIPSDKLAILLPDKP